MVSNCLRDLDSSSIVQVLGQTCHTLSFARFRSQVPPITMFQNSLATLSIHLITLLISIECDWEELRDSGGQSLLCREPIIATSMERNNFESDKVCKQGYPIIGRRQGLLRKTTIEQDKN